MKVICTDNYARESVADRLVAEGLTEEQAAAKVGDLNVTNRNSNDWYRAVSDDYRLSRGMEDLV